MSAKPEWVPPDMNVWLATTETETDSMCGCTDEVFDSWVGTHRCPDMPRRIWLDPIMVGRIDGTPFAHYGECGWTIGVAGLFVAWMGWTQ
jgi:hypothetical protein